MSDVMVLGPQFRTPNLGVELARARLDGPLVSITAGWQEREGEIAALDEHLGRPVRDLRLYERAEAVFARDAAFHDAYRARQNELRRLQDLYRMRLDHAKAAARELMALPDESDLLRAARRSAVGALRRIDAGHLHAIRRIHARFEARYGAAHRPDLAEQRAELEHLLDRAQAVCIAGGHVAVLLNRLRLFGLEAALRRKPVVAWSAGAMAISERVVLYHDHPPQGAGNAEVFESGLGLVRGVVLLPQASTRLALVDERRVGLLARRFAPASCCTLEDGSSLRWRGGRLATASGSSRLLRTGRLAPVGDAR